MGTVKKHKGIALFAAVILLFALSVSALGGCTMFDDEHIFAEFTKSRINLSVGDTYELENIISSNVDGYWITTSNISVAEVNGTLLRAVGVGSATLKISSNDTYDDTLRVVVSNEDSIKIVADGALLQSVGSESAVIMRAELTGAAADDDIIWYVNGIQKTKQPPSESFSFKPSGAGETEVQAVCALHNGVTDSVVIRTYYPITAIGTATGNFEQDGAPYSLVILDADAQSDIRNPDNYIEWKVDGETVYSGNETSFAYTPTPGEHEITLCVNGEPRKVNGSTYVTTKCYGTIVPKSVEVEFDNVYPHIYVRTDAVGRARFEITFPDGKVKEYDETAYPDMFDGGVFDAGEVIRLCASYGSGSTYGIRVKSLGDGEYLRESEYSESHSFKQLPRAAQSYLSDFYLNRDHYITSDNEYVHMFEYYVLSRPKNVIKPRIKFDCYMGYESMYTPEELWRNAFNIAATSGSYTGRGAWIDDKIDKVLHTESYVNTVNNPSKETYKSPSQYSKQLHTTLPHINYDTAKYRPENYVFPIDRYERTQSVSYSDELYYAAQSGARPTPVAGSSADTIYKMARSVLRKIVTDDMTDKQKAHAIYDWIMWQVTYDTPATAYMTGGEAYSAYYLEGVFGDGKTSIGGVVYHPYAVCDGMSKAYSLMCGIEGIPCVRIAGMAGKDIANSGGHAWNKVKVDGQWYIVDCTWGDSFSSISFDGDYDDYEFGLHNWLFLTDAQANDTHYEPYLYHLLQNKSNECDLIYAPRTAAAEYSVYEDMVYNGTEIDCLVKSGESQSERVSEIVSAFARAYTPVDTIYVPGTLYEYYDVPYQSVEISFEDDIGLSNYRLRSIIETAVHKVRPFARTEMYKYENLLVVLIS